MIAFLHGRLASRDSNHVVVDVSGVGYLLEIPLGAEHELPCLLYTSDAADE